MVSKTTQASADVRHWTQDDYVTAACGAGDGWWVKTPRQVTCRACQALLPKTIHWLSRVGAARCGQHVTSTTATVDVRRVSCSRCVPRPSRKTDTVVHLRRAVGADRSLCNVPWANQFTDSMEEVDCLLCQSRWAPRCPICDDDKVSRDPTCRATRCKTMYRREQARDKRQTA